MPTEEIKYDPGAMDRLFDELKNNGSKIQGEIDALQTAANNFLNNLEGEKAQTAFTAAHKNVNEELGDTLTTLDRLAAEVENAKHLALEADGKVGDGFAAF
ncbi:WXG100 family type VII secretion target [Nocardia sp. CDC159]|uniref:WXG100 family type VII secretion target n=1 Tax=Nocardia pulmonis TaxID=2951408 RepID=A0A9X2E866_9NOCA|nr:MULTISPECIES: WXG100 family type VII secretion target [Nocardia]MCM6776097.1 WXG100 family type VII secretion target [Nocardia pulmonis]MCM6788576.1 WXG100 family type VII secretion target [Nocardia sp. CDC159]